MSTQVFTLPLNATLSANDHLTVLPTQVVGARDKEVWAVVPAAALSWHWVNLPSGLQKQNNRLLPALQGLMEEMLLDEPEAVHLALQPGWQSGAPAWVAVCNKAWLRQHLHQLQSSGHMVHRIVPEWAPAPFTLPHAAQAWVSGVPEDAWLWVSDSQGAWRLPLQAGFKLWAERLSALSNDDAAALTQLLIQAEPAVSELAQKSLQTLQSLFTGKAAEALASWRIAVTPAAERYAQAAASQWDLAQFEFAAHGTARWLQSMQRAWQKFAHETAWRPVRWSLAVLIAAQFVGLNVAAWQLNSKVKQQRDFQKNILTQTFPNVPVVDIPLQMARELERLQRNAGSLNAKDLESVLQAIGMALADGQNISGIQFSGQGAGEVRLQGLQLSSAQQAEFIRVLRAQGYDAQVNGAQWRVVSSQGNKGGA